MRRLLPIPGANTSFFCFFIINFLRNFDRSKTLQLSLRCTECLDTEMPRKHPTLTKNTAGKKRSRGHINRNADEGLLCYFRKKENEYHKCRKEHASATCISITNMIQDKLDLENLKVKKKQTDFIRFPSGLVSKSYDFYQHGSDYIRKVWFWEPVPNMLLSQMGIRLLVRLF